MSQINELIAKYLKLRAEQAQLNLEMTKTEQEIALYCTKNKKKKLAYQNLIFLVIQKTKSVFPIKSSPKRKELEAILTRFGISSEFKSIDITKLATAYDLRKLPTELMEALRPLAGKRPFIRISQRLASPLPR